MGRRGPGALPQAGKREQYARLTGQGYNNSEACRIAGINRRTGKRWRHGRTITTRDGRKFAAKLVGRDAATDVALLQLQGASNLKAMPLGDSERLHELPAGEIGDADITQIARTHERIQRRQHLLDRCEGVEGVELEQIDVVGA